MLTGERRRTTDGDLNSSWRPWPVLGPESSLHEYWSPAPCGEDYVVATPAAAARDPDTRARLVRFTQELLAPHLP